MDKIFLSNWASDILENCGYKNKTVIDGNLNDLVIFFLSRDIHVMIKKSKEPWCDYILYVDDMSFRSR